MIFGDDKVREMTRSILPSTSRDAARRRPMIHRSERHRANAAVRAMVSDPTTWDEGIDPPDAMQREIAPMVRRRRYADKLNHFERWAVERTRELPAELRLGHLLRVLPPGVIGDHASSHLEDRRELMTEEQYALRFPWRARPYRRARVFLDRGEAAQLLRRLLQLPDAHRALNRALKDLVEYERSQRRELPLRVLLGVHDVLPFLGALEGWKMEPLKRVVHAFLRGLKNRR